MTRLTALFGLATASVLLAPARFTSVALACESGCVTADSVQVAEALRAGLSHTGVTVVVRRAVLNDLPLLVTGRITVQGGEVRVAAEFVELERELSRFTVLSPRPT